MSQFKPMLAKGCDYDEAGQPKVKYPIFVQPKLDGIRASVVNGKLVSRTLKPIPNQEIRAALECALYEGLDGELIVGDPTAEDVYRRTCSFAMASDKTGEPWCFYVFDKWDEEGRMYGERYEAAVSRVENGVMELLDGDQSRVRMVPNVTCVDAGELMAVEAELIAQGYEGAIARVPQSLYKFGRSGKTGPLLKIKRFIDFEAEVIGVYEEQHNGNVAVTNALGRTERSTAQAGKVGKGTLGGLVLRALNGPCEGVEFRCGTGFDAATRRELWSGEEGGTEGAALIGGVAKIKSFPVGVKDKPRFPVWLGWRAAEDMPDA